MEAKAISSKPSSHQTTQQNHVPPPPARYNNAFLNRSIDRRGNKTRDPNFQILSTRYKGKDKWTNNATSHFRSIKRSQMLTLPSLHQFPLRARPVVLTLPLRFPLLRTPPAERPPTRLDTPINNEYMNMKISTRIRPPYIHGDVLNVAIILARLRPYRSMADLIAADSRVLSEVFAGII